MRSCVFRPVLRPGGRKTDMTEAALIWSDVLDRLSRQIPQNSLSLWFKDATVTDYNGNSITVVAENEFKKITIQSKYIGLLEKLFEESTGRKISVLLTSAETQNREEEKLFESSIAEVQKIEANSPSDEKLLEMTKGYTFENFVVGSSNRVAQASAFAVASDPVTTINPLFLYGPSGLGKTHLMFAIINEVKRKNPRCNIVYITGEQFTNELIDALAAKKNEENVAFRDKYRNCDMLLVDDIQFIAGKYSIQEEFFHTFDALYKMKKQIVLTSDRSPKDIQHLEDRLVTRFEMGLITDIQPPDPELRTAIFKIKTKEAGIELSNEVLTFLAENIRSNIRQIEGAIKKLWAQSFITGEKITLDMAKEVLKDYFKPDRRRELTPENILNYVAKRYGIVRDDILGKKRTSELVYARHIAIYLTCELTDLSLKKVGKQFNRDHATIISAKNSVVTRMKNDAAFANDINESICELTGEEPQ